MTALMEKIKKFFEGCCACCSNKTVQPIGGQENRLQQKEPQPTADQPKKKPEQQPGS